MGEYIVDTFGIVQDFADLHGDMNMPLYQAIMDVMVSRQHEELVRCRDCVWFCAGSEQYATDDWCKNFGCEIEPDGFCAWGERK